MCAGAAAGGNEATPTPRTHHHHSCSHNDKNGGMTRMMPELIGTMTMAPAAAARDKQDGDNQDDTDEGQQQ